MYLKTLRPEKEFVHIKPVKKEINSLRGCPEFLPYSPFSIKAKEFVPFREIFKKLVEELNEKESNGNIF